jgi:uncharacterized membrane protein
MLGECFLYFQCYVFTLYCNHIMNSKKFSIGESFKFGLEHLKADFPFILTVVIGVLVISAILGLFGKGNAATITIANILSIIFNIIVNIGLVRVVLRYSRNGKPSFQDFAVTEYITPLNYIIGTIVYFLIVLVGLVLFIIPGIILAVRLKFYSYLIVEKHMSALDALKESLDMTRGSTVDLILFILMGLVINFVGALFFGVGLIVTIPVTYIAQGYVYRAFSKIDTVTEVVPEPPHLQA